MIFKYCSKYQKKKKIFFTAFRWLLQNAKIYFYIYLFFPVFRLSLQNATTCSAILVYKESLKLVTESVQRVQQVLGLMMSNLFTFDRKPRKLCFCFLMRPAMLRLGAYDLVHIIGGLVYDTNKRSHVLLY